MDRKLLNRFQIYPIGIGLLGVFSFEILALPLPFLLGPVFACLTAALLGVRMEQVKVLTDSTRTILGVALGASLSAPIILGMLNYWPTLLLILLQTALIGVLGTYYFHKICKYDFATSYFAAMPGGLQDMIVFGEEAGGNVRAISLLHATRVMCIVVLLPIILQWVWQADLSNPPGRPVADFSWDQIMLMVLAGIGGWQMAKRVGMFGASILGPMIFAGVLSVFGWLETRPPAEFIWLSQFFIGMLVGAKYTGITMAEVRRDILFGAGFTVMLMVITLGFIALIRSLDLAPMLDALMSFTPGGQAELVVLSIIIGANLPFIMTHHLLRISAVIMLSPIVARMMGVRR